MKIIDAELVERLYQYCYARTSCSHEAQELCSDILYTVVRSSRMEGELGNQESYFWGIARKVYADYCADRRVRAERTATGDMEEILAMLPDNAEEACAERREDQRLLENVLRQIAFLSKAYREVMVGFYLDGKSTARLSAELHISETAVRQRLFAARNDVRNEVGNMEERDKIQKPTALQEMSLELWGTGNPGDGDPREVCSRQLSKHVVWLCRNRPVSAKAVSEELGVPMPYIEEELDIQVRGQNDRYGLLRRTDSGKFVTNFVLLDEEEIREAWQFYIDCMPKICDTVAEYIERHREEYLSFPYLNKMPTLNLILWQQVKPMSGVFAECVGRKLKEKYFSDTQIAKRPFTVFGYRLCEGIRVWGGGRDGIEEEAIGGYKRVYLQNIYCGRIKAHFHCSHNIFRDKELAMAVRAVEGLPVKSLGEKEEEVAAKAIECGYLYRDGDVLYTKFLVSDAEEEKRLFAVTRGMKAAFDGEADRVAAEIAGFIRRNIPKHLMGDYLRVNELANLPVLDTLVEALIDRGLLNPPENGVGAEGIWMMVER